jgi:alpha-beta hydrolase superfamily lysophospholipase
LDRLGNPRFCWSEAHDPEVIELNQQALEAITTTEKQLIIIPGATHLFEEPGKLDEVAEFSVDWFKRHLQ